MPPSNIRKIIFSLKKYIFLEEQTTQLTDILWLKYFAFSSIRMVDEIGGEKRRGGEKRGQYFCMFQIFFHVSIYFAFEIFLTSVLSSRKVLTYIVPLFDLSVNFTCEQIFSAI